jgi:AcrR family transcriptional regulator
MEEREVRLANRRVQKTRHLLHQALASLVRKKPYDAISVEEILDRANVGRSTFYAHFGDKDQLLASSARDMVRFVPDARLPMSAARHEAFIAFSLPGLRAHSCSPRRK